MTQAELTVTDQLGRRVVVIDKPLFTIGRRSTADLHIRSADVSREHAEIAYEDGRFVLRDRGSRYGTCVNKESVRERVLVHGDRIRLGPSDAVELVFTESATASSLRDTSQATDLRQMTAILNGLRALGSGRVLEEVLTLVLDSALEVTRTERGFIMLADGRGELEFKTARGQGGVTLPGTSFTTSEKIPREVFSTGQSRIVSDLMDGNLPDVHNGTIAVGIRYVICVPLHVGPTIAGTRDGRQQVIGVLYLDGRERSPLLSHGTLSSLEAFATQAALAIESARLYAEASEKARIERDLRVAADIQRRLLPEPMYDAPLWDLAAISIPCRTVGGDFYDYLELPDGRFGFGLGDVAGKGPPAALLATALQSNFVAHAPVSDTPAEMMARINRALLRRAIEARFATMFYGALAPGGELSYCNAGQEPPLVLRRTGQVAWLDTGGPVLGLLSIATYQYAAIRLEPRDLVIVCSDGVTEARNEAGDEFGRERILDAVRGRHAQIPDAVLEALTTAVRAFSEHAAQADDITAMVVRYKG